jgi:hypothetical protein
MFAPPGNLRQIPPSEIAASAKQDHRTTGKFSWRTRLPMYDYITKSCRQQAQAVQNHENAKFTTSEKEKPDIKYKRLNLAAVKRTTIQVTRQPL